MTKQIRKKLKQNKQKAKLKNRSTLVPKRIVQLKQERTKRQNYLCEEVKQIKKTYLCTHKTPTHFFC